MAGLAPTAPSRSAWIDNLRTAMVVLVVNMHACVTYSHVGGWYLKDPPEPPLGAKISFLYWQGHLQAFFMGLLFFLAGAFAHGACTKRGPAAFIQERLLRLGAPAALYMLLIQPFIGMVLLGTSDQPTILERYSRYLSSGRVLSGSGPLWFAIALLIFCGTLAIWRIVRPVASPVERRPQPSPTQIILFAGVLVLATFLFRLVQPLDTDFFNMQLGFFAQYIAVFSAGVLAGRYGWIEGLASSTFAARAGWLVLIAGPLGLTATLLFGGAMQSGNFQPFKGGWHWQAFGLAAWEQLSGVALGLGAMALFRRRFNSDGPRLRWMSRHSFGVYVLHAPILVALTLLMHPLSTGPVVKMLLLTVLGLISSHGAAALALRTPGLRRIL